MLKPKQEQAALLLAQGKLCREVAQELEVTPQTISEWKRNAEFEAFTNTLRGEGVMAAITRMHGLTTEAVATFAELMKPGKPESIRLKAATLVLEHAGLTDPQSTQFAMAFGPTTEADVLQARKRDKYSQSLADSILG